MKETHKLYKVDNFITERRHTYKSDQSFDSVSTFKF